MGDLRRDWAIGLAAAQVFKQFGSREQFNPLTLKTATFKAHRSERHVT